MDRLRLVGWTRRGFGLAVGGMVAALHGAAALQNPASKRKKRKKQCRKVTRACTPGNKKKRCCKGLHCGVSESQTSSHCCRTPQAPCESANECCGELFCQEIFPGSGMRCCVPPSKSCETDNDCCGAFICLNGFCD